MDKWWAAPWGSSWVGQLDSTAADRGESPSVGAWALWTAAAMVAKSGNQWDCRTAVQSGTELVDLMAGC